LINLKYPLVNDYTLKVSGHGGKFKSKESSFSPIVLDEFRKKIIEGLKEKHTPKTTTDEKGKGMGGPPQVGFNPADPEQAGWTFLVNNTDSVAASAIQNAIRPLAIHRGKFDFNRPLIFKNEAEENWLRLIGEYKIQTESQYILIIGDLQSIPLDFQNLLSTDAFVGRLDFDDVNEIKTYAEKIVRIETSGSGFVNKEATFFATDQGVNSSGCYDPTHFTRFDVEKELIPNVDALTLKNTLPNKFSTNKLTETDATKENLKHSIKESTPGLVLTSSWGLCAPGEDLGLQKKIGGAICCQPEHGDVPFEKLLFTANDVLSEPFLEGGVFFQQSSFGFGTPSVSEIYKWIRTDDEWGLTKDIAPTSFVSALPKKLIFHPKGPLAFIGHFDEMLSYTIASEDDFQLEDRKTRMNSMSFAIENILLGAPVGYALKKIKADFNTINNRIAAISGPLVSDLRLGKEVEDSRIEEFSDLMLKRHKTKNYMIFGDPAVRIQQWA